MLRSIIPIACLLLSACGSDISVNEALTGDEPDQQLTADHYEGGAMLAAMNDRFSKPEGDSPCDRFLNIVSHAQYPAMAVVWSTFGDDLTCVRKFIAAFSDRPHLLEIHFSNETCRRSKCEKEELMPSWGVEKMNAALEREDKPLGDAVNSRMLDIYAAVAALRASTTKVILSTGLEDNYTDKAFDHMQLWLRMVWADQILRNPVSHGNHYKGGADLLEHHNPDPRFAGQSCIASEDGLYDRQTKQTRDYFLNSTNCLATLFWRPNFQGRAKGQALTPPKSRTFTVTDTDVRELSTVFTQPFDIKAAVARAIQEEQENEGLVR